jgi:hypothetical protein
MRSNFSISVLLLSVPLLTLILADGCVFAASEATELLDVDTADQEQVKPSPKEEPSKSRFDFRKTNWGMTKEQVKSTESGKLEAEQDNMLQYSDRVAGKDVRIGYIFVANKLVRSKYIFTEKHTNNNLFLSDYEEIKDILSEKYGPPGEDKSMWINKLYQDDRQYWGMAVSAGHVRFWSTWDTPSTTIFHVLKGDNFKISLVTQYASKELKKLEQQSEKNKTLSDF